MLRIVADRIILARFGSELVRRASSSACNPLLDGQLDLHRQHTPKDGFVFRSPYEAISIPDMTLDQYIWKNMAKWKNHVAVVCGITGRKYTYARLRDHCAALALRLRKEIGLQQDDIVAICLPNEPEYPIAVLGAIEAGLIVTTVNPRYSSEEISRQLISSRPKLIFCVVDNFDVVKKACELAGQSDIKLVALKTSLNQTIHSDMINFMDLINVKGLNLSEAGKFNENANLENLVMLPYSSGTTGLPKGVMLTHNNLTSNCEAVDVKLPVERLVLPTTNDFQEVFPCVLPFYHAYGLVVILFSKLALGCKLVTIPKFEMNLYSRVVREHKATFLCLVPPIIIQLGNNLNIKKADYKDVRHVMSAASSLAQTDAERFKENVVNAEFFQGYGLTETSPIATLKPKGIDNYATIGWPISNVEMKIASIDDPKLIGLDVRQSGEILIRGPNVMKGYFKNDEATKAMITEDGWLRSGDIGHYDENGLFYISDRMKELIKVNALQVAPAELEGVLREHPNIVDAVVVGVPDRQCGEVPKAFVVLRPGSTISEDDVKTFVASRVAKFKQLGGGVQFIDSIPKTPTGKILRREVKKLFC